VEVATLYFTRKADTWLENTDLNLEEIAWHKFCKKLKKRFAKKSTYDVVKTFHALKQSGTVDEYIDVFEGKVGPVCRENTEIAKNYYVKSFVAGLQDYEQHHTQIQKPTSLIDAYWIARRIEASSPFRKGAHSKWTPRSQNYQKTLNPNKDTVTKTPIQPLLLHPNPLQTPYMSNLTNASDVVKNSCLATNSSVR
jgi:hypothetical protein